MRDTINSQYNSFLYWRMPIPELDLSELERLELTDRAVYKPKGSYGNLMADRKKQGVFEEETDKDTLLQFNSFNFWRAPIASITALDFDLL
ncbi:protein AF1q [Heteronotia binoei]|uniref:protein AF1q n=1 Tax=Heteronotia binoei TaxID=13085 RepID=UPI0029316234|nr:protein AF1q [Heteronotia binoei]